MNPKATAANTKQAWLLCLALLLGCLWIYGRVGSFGYVAYDDNTYVYENAHVLAGLSAESIGWALGSTSYGANWHPLTWLSHMLDVELFGVQRPGYAHWENVLWHVASAWLLFWGLWRASGRLAAAFFAAALFAWHPLRVESVAWISERKDVLSGFFLCLTIWSYASWCRRRSSLRYLWIALSLALGLMAKPMLVSAPFLLLVLDAWPLNRLRHWKLLPARLSEKAPLFGLVLLSAWLTFQAQSSDGVVSASLPLGLRLANASASLWTYLLQSVWPFELGCIYPLASSVSLEPMSLLTLPASLGLAALLCISYGAWSLRFRFPPLAAAWIWYLLALIPVIGLIQVGDQAHADRYTYVPLVGLAAAAALGMDRLLQAKSSLRILATALGALLLAGLLWISQRQVSTWENSHTLFARALEVEPRNPIALANAGACWQQVGEHEKALARLEAAVAIGSPRFGVNLNLSSAYLSLGQTQKARQLLERLAEQYPLEWRVQSNLGELAFASQQLGAAKAHYTRAIELGSDNEQDELQLGVLLLESDPAAARTHLQRALALNSRSVKANYAMGQLALRLNRVQEAIGHFERAVQYSSPAPAPLLQALEAARARL